MTTLDIWKVNGKWVCAITWRRFCSLAVITAYANAKGYHEVRATF